MAKSVQHPLMLQLTSLLKEWQTRLNLNHWKITVEVDDEIDAWGVSSTSVAMNSAKIRIRDPKTCPDDWSGVSDIEATLVHELLHVRFSQFDHILHSKKSRQMGTWCQFEQALDQTSLSLVAAKHGWAKF